MCHLAWMRIHLQNPPGETLFSFSEAMWDAATGRAGPVGSGHTVSIGQTAEDFAEVMLTAEALVADAGVIRGLLPLHAPRLKLVFATLWRASERWLKVKFTEIERRQLEAYIRVRQAMGKMVRDLFAA